MSRWIRVAACIAIMAAWATVFAAVAPGEQRRFDRFVIEDPSGGLGVVAEAQERITGFDTTRAGWDAFRAQHGPSWNVWVDRRSGAPLLVEGAGIVWVGPGQEPNRALLEAKARELVAANEAAFRTRPAELTLNANATGATDRDHWVVVFDRVVAGVPVEGERFVLYVTRGKLVSFGASRWGAVPAAAKPSVGADAALAILEGYMGLTPQDRVDVAESGHLVFVATASAAGAASRYTGTPGEGVEHRLVWRFGLSVLGEPGTWIGKVDAVSGKVLAFYDDDRYARVKGGAYPISNDQNCAELGCELPGFPMPYATVNLAKKPNATGDMGFFTCGKGPKNSSANLLGPYVRVTDTCGLATASGNCTNDLDFGFSGGTDCTTPTGGGSGDTHAGRTSYYHLNRIKEKARYWLPANAWAGQQLQSKVNTNATCNAFWNGSVNFYKSGGGCNNTGEIAGVINHEYGHGLDANDGGGAENPGEAYADVIAILQDHRSCVGRGFFQSGNCGGYGDTCLACSGIRDMDWDRRVRHTPATPANFTLVNCGGGGGPCGREVHCESYVPSEAIYDLAVRDLPAMGLDADSSWQLAERLFYKSRQGSGGNAFNCALPSSDGCNAAAWFNKLRNVDDDDGNLANGTPHAAAIFSAFSRHAIACGTPTDASNLNSATCGSLATPAVVVTPGTGSVTVSWPAVAGAANYLILRNDIGCATTSNVIATVAAPGTSYLDDLLPAGFNLYYRVQAQTANTACESRVSACVSAVAN